MGRSGGGYFYFNLGTHLLPMLVRCVTGKPMEDLIRAHLAEPVGWGPWGYPPLANGVPAGNTPGGGGIAVRATDMLRYAYLLLHKGQWNGKQLIPAAYLELCAKPPPSNPHTPF